MEPVDIAAVYSTASKLHSRLDDAIARQDKAESLDGVSYGSAHGLRGIRDCLQALKGKLDSLQILQKQQKADRYHLLVELEESRKVLTRKLRDYSGKEWEIVQEAYAFATKPVETESDLMLPPYQSPVPDIVSYAEREVPTSDLKQWSLTIGDDSSQRKSLMTLNETSTDDVKPLEISAQVKGKFGDFTGRLTSGLVGAMQAIGFSAKTAIVLIGVATVVSFSPLGILGSHAKGARKASKLNFLENTGKRQDRFSSPSLVMHDMFCPPGKVLVVQDGVQKCFVKERIEAPFKEVVQQPDASYGYG